MSACIYIISDSTAETGWKVANSALNQFADVAHQIVRVPDIRDREAIETVARRLKRKPERAFVMYTFADTRLAEIAAETFSAQAIPALDLIGPIIERLSDFFAAKPIARPGMQHRVDDLYDARIQAIEFSVGHDDGLGLRTADSADVVLIGPSRTGKTPLSMYLANRGYRVTNLPFIPGQPLPEFLTTYSGPIVGITIDPEALVRFREQRVQKSGGDVNASGYADFATVKREIQDVVALYRRNDWHIIDVTAKAIEEVAVEVLALFEPGLASIA